MTQNVEQAGTAGRRGRSTRTRRRRRGLRGRPQVAQPVAARLAQVPQAPAWRSSGSAIIAVLLLVAIIGPVLLPFSFTDIPDPTQVVRSAGRRSARPSTPREDCQLALTHPMGETGGLQRDVLTLVVNGARTSLLIGFSSMAIGVFIGTFVGAIAGFVGGIVDNLADARSSTSCSACRRCS